MSTKLTIFTATLVQDSALSVSGLDRESTSDQPFTVTMIDDEPVPVLSGRGLKGAAVAMAQRFFDPLPRAVSEIGRHKELRRSAWLFRNAERIGGNEKPRLRSGVGILQTTGARATGVLYDREVMPKGTKWDLDLRVDWRLVGSDERAEEAEGILGYVLDKHWKEGRCWLGGGAARGLGFCHLTDLKAYRISFDDKQYAEWVKSKRTLEKLTAEPVIPHRSPTKSWYFRTLDVEVSFGAYRPEGSDSDWGVDMLAIGPHEIEQGSQRKGTGRWARPSWADPSAPPPDEQLTQRSILMDGDAPLIPGSSVRGPLRHAFSRAKRRSDPSIQDPHDVQGKVSEQDAAGKLFGTVDQSSTLLIRDASAEGDWTAARLHMHAEDEFSAGSYGSAKRDAVRLLSGKFSVRFVVEGGNKEDIAGKQKELDRLIALGQLGHLPIGGHKTKGAGFGVWKPGDWQLVDVLGVPKREVASSGGTTDADKNDQREPFLDAAKTVQKWIHIDHLGTEKAGPNVAAPLTLKDICEMVPSEVKESLTAWWCEPAIDFSVDQPKTFGRCLPSESTLKVEEAVFFSPSAAFRMAKTKRGWKKVLIQECDEKTTTAQSVTVTETPARLHRDDTNRFTAHLAESGTLLIKEWRHQGQTMGYTLSFGSK